MVSVYTEEEIISTPHPYFYHSYPSLFLYPLNQFILYINIYLSLLSLLSSPILSSPLLSYPIRSSIILSYPLPKINVGLLGLWPCGRGWGGWGFDNENITNPHENTTHADLTSIRFLCSLLSLMDRDNPWVWYLPILSGYLFTPLPYYFILLSIYIWILKT